MTVDREYYILYGCPSAYMLRVLLVDIYFIYFKSSSRCSAADVI